MNRRKPTRSDLLAAADKRLRDVMAPDLTVLFCGINPGLYSAFTGHHFARPGNRFWPALFAGGFSDRLLQPFEERELLPRFGITNLVERATATADQLTPGELIAGARTVRINVRRYRPRFLAVLGVGAYRIAFACPKAVLGLQLEEIGSTCIWVLPSPSGLNAHYQAGDLATLFRSLYMAAKSDTSR